VQEINCYIPIKICISGQLNEAQLDELGATLTRTLISRIKFAERTVAERTPHSLRGRVEVLREEFDPRREDRLGGEYLIPSYRDGGQSGRVSLRHAGAQRRPWAIEKSIAAHIRVRNFVAFLESLDQKSDPAWLIKTLYPERLEEVRPLRVWLIKTSANLWGATLVKDVASTYARFIPEGKQFYYAHFSRESDRRRLHDLAEPGHQLSQLPGLGANFHVITPDGDFIVPRGRWVVFVAITLPDVKLEETLFIGLEIEIPMTVGELDFIVTPDDFGKVYGTSWSNFKKEFGKEPATLWIVPVTPLRRTHYSTLKFLMDDVVAYRVDKESAYFGNLHLLNQTRLNLLPSAVRTRTATVTNDATRQLTDDKQQDFWEKGWAGAYIYAVIHPTQDQLNIARYKPGAREQADELIRLLKEEPYRISERIPVIAFFRNLFGSPPTEGGLVFEFLMAELEARGQLDHLFDWVEKSDDNGLLIWLLRLSQGTRYANHPRVLKATALMNKRQREGREHTYRLPEKEIWIDRKPGLNWSVGTVLGDIWDLYIFERKSQRLKPSRLPDLKQAMEEEAKELFGRILRGEDQNSYDEETFAKTVLGKAAERIHLSEKDFEEITIQRSMILVDLQSKVKDTVERFYITFAFVERIEGEKWPTLHDIPAAAYITEVEGDFEARLIYWALGRAGEWWEIAGLVVTIGGLIVFAWSAGIIALLVEAGGGATTVVLSISISELIYLGKIIFGDETWSLKKFLMAALDGYLMAVGFRGAAILGRGVAGLIGTRSMTALIGGWVAEKLIVGTVGGAGSAFLTTFSHDLIRIFGCLNNRARTGCEKGFSSPEEYVDSMKHGAALGVVFEFGIGALQPILRVGGRSALESLTEVVQNIKEAGISPAQFTAWTTEALANMRRQFGEVMDAAIAGRFTQAFRQRISQVTEQLGAEYRLAVFRRVLELSPEALTRESTQGLEKLLSASKADLSNEAILAILNRLNPNQLRSFLESVNTLEPTMIGVLSRGNALEALANAPQLAMRVGSDAALIRMISGRLGAEQGYGRLLRGGHSRLLDEIKTEIAPHSPNLARQRLDQIGSLTDQQAEGLAAIERAGRLGDLGPHDWGDVLDLHANWRGDLLDLTAQVQGSVDGGLDLAIRRGLQGPGTNVQGALGHFYAARTLLGRFPGSRLRFEIEATSREIDIQVSTQGRTIDVEVKTNLGQSPSIAERQIRRDLIRHIGDQFQDMLYLYAPQQAGNLQAVRDAMLEALQHPSVQTALQQNGIALATAQAWLQQRFTQGLVSTFNY
jgi:hypothetical protein